MAAVPPFFVVDELPTELLAKLGDALKSVNAETGVELDFDAVMEGKYTHRGPAALQALLGGVAQQLPIMYWNAERVERLRVELDWALADKILVMEKKDGVLTGNIGKKERVKFRKAPQRYQLLIEIFKRFKAVVDACPERNIPFLGDDGEPILLVRQVRANRHATASADAWHWDLSSGLDDHRIPFPPDVVAKLRADPNVQVNARVVSTIAATGHTRYAECFGHNLVTFSAGCDGGGVSLGGPSRSSMLPGEATSLLHASEVNGVPLRLQIVSDWCLWAPQIYNRVMAGFLARDMLALKVREPALIAALYDYNLHG